VCGSRIDRNKVSTSLAFARDDMLQKLNVMLQSALGLHYPATQVNICLLALALDGSCICCLHKALMLQFT
jgi:hypothetical protein